MTGHHVLHPMGWDAFLRPAGRTIRNPNGHPPARDDAAEHCHVQAADSERGFSYDWDREVDTTDPEYVKWTQWIFLQIFDTWYDPEQNKGRPISESPIPPEVRARGEASVRRYQDARRLAYESEIPVWWCPALGTVLANEEVIDGKSERGNHPCERRPLRQWVLRITAYADRLLNDLDLVDWPESIKTMQREWIGRSEADVRFHRCTSLAARCEYSLLDRIRSSLATYMVLSPEHPLLDLIHGRRLRRTPLPRNKTEAAKKSDLERTELAKIKTGVFTGAYAINPVNQEKIPIWIADYVLTGYGTGAIMAVPGHDERDCEFAEAYDLPIMRTVQPPGDWQGKAYVGDGPAINSEFLNGLHVADAKRKIIDWLEQKGLGQRRINYKLRDWLFSRQRYWGEPFPILHESDASGKPTGLLRPVPESDLPVRLPDLEDFKPTGSPEGPLSKATDWLTGHDRRQESIAARRTRCRNGPARAGTTSAIWTPRTTSSFAHPRRQDTGCRWTCTSAGPRRGAAPAVLGGSGTRCFTIGGILPTPEPFKKLVNQGMILGEMEFANGSNRLGEDEVEKRGDKFVLKADPSVAVEARAHKMSKARGNVISPRRGQGIWGRFATAVLQGEMAEAFEAWRKARGNLGEELADIAIYLFSLAQMTGVDLQDEIDAKLAKNASRSYRQLPNGVLVKSEDPGGAVNV